MVSANRIQHMIHPIPAGGVENNADKVLRMAIDGRPTKGPDNLRFFRRRGGPHVRYTRPSAQLQGRSAHTTTTSVDQHRMFCLEVTEVMQHVVCGEVGHRHGRGCLEVHAFRNPNNAVCITCQVARLCTGARHRDDGITNGQTLNLGSDLSNRPGCLVSWCVGVRRSWFVQTEALQKVGEIDARKRDIDENLTWAGGPWLEGFDAHGFWGTGLGQHQPLAHDTGSRPTVSSRRFSTTGRAKMALNGARIRRPMSTHSRQTAGRVLDAVAQSGTHYGSGFPMIASENVISPLVRRACDSDLHGRYAEGLPGKRYYQGCEDFDTIETIGIDLAKKTFNASFANIQPISGTVANIAALKALVKPGDRITAVSTADGGHISHAQMGAVGLRGLDLHTYPWDEDRMEPDLDAAAAMIRETKPALALFGASVFLFPTPLEELASAAHEVGAQVMYDGAHVLGLIAGGVFQDPLREGADVMTGSSHKTFPGPQGGFLLSNTEDETMQRRLNNAVFPGTNSSYHLHHVAGKAVALAEFEAYGASYAQDTVTNARALAEALAAEGFDVLAEERGYTASHQVLTRHGETDSGAGRAAATLLEEAGIITNMNMLPGDTRALSPSGLRLGVQELTRHGMGPDQMQDVATCFRRALIDGVDPSKVKAEVAAIREGFTEVQYCFEA